MSYFGDIRLGDTIDIKFTTRRFSTGAPYTLAGTPAVAAYVGNSTTEITAGITLTVDFDARTGLNNVRVVATSGNGYATATNVKLVLTAGTVDSVSVVGEVVGSFSIENRSALMPTTATRTLDVTAGGEAGVDWANIGSPTTVVGLSGTTVKTATDVETDTADIQSRIGTVTDLGSGATVAANLADVGAALVSIIGRIGAWAGTGVNTILGAFKALLSKTASAPSDIGGTFDPATDSTEALRDRGDAAWTTATGFSTLDAAGVRTAVGLASANLDTQLAAIDDYLDTEIAAIKTVTDQFTAAQSEPSSVPAANASPLAKIAFLAALARNKITQTATTQTLRNDADSGNIATSTHSDDGTTHTRSEWV